MSAVVSALAAANASAMIKVLFRKSVCDGVQARALLQYYHIIGAAVLIAVFGFPDYAAMSASTLGLMLLSGFCWAFGALYRTKAYRDLEASETNIVGTLSLVLVTAVAILFFGESLSVAGLAGLVIILLSIAAGTEAGKMRFSPAMRDLLLSVLLITGALIIDRMLTDRVAVSEIAVSTLLIPALVFFASDPAGALRLGVPPKELNFAFLAAPLLGAFRTYCLLYALAHGSLAVTYALLNTCVVFVFVYETCFLRLSEGRLRRGAYCVCCALGAVMVTAYG